MNTFGNVERDKGKLTFTVKIIQGTSSFNGLLSTAQPVNFSYYAPTHRAQIKCRSFTYWLWVGADKLTTLGS